MGQPDRRPTAAAALTHKGNPATNGLALKTLGGLTLFAWAGVAHTLGVQAEIRWVLAAAAAALACTIAAIAAAALGIACRMLDANSRRTMESTREQAERMIEATREQVDRLIEATRQHADSMERMTKAHAQALRAQILDLNWLLTAKFRGEALAQMDADHEPGRFNPSDTGPFPTVRNGR